MANQVLEQVAEVKGKMYATYASKFEEHANVITMEKTIEDFAAGYLQHAIDYRERMNAIVLLAEQLIIGASYYSEEQMVAAQIKRIAARGASK